MKETEKEIYYMYEVRLRDIKMPNLRGMGVLTKLLAHSQNHIREGMENSSEHPLW